MRDSATIWKHIGKQGGLWSGRELVEAMPALRGAHVQGVLHDMWKARQLVRHPTNGDRAFKYGITATCVVPREVTVAELLDMFEDTFMPKTTAKEPA